MAQLEVLSRSPQETQRLGEKLANYLRRGDIVCLNGELGSGKTTLVKGLAQGLQIDPRGVISPTFVLMNAYKGRLPAAQTHLPVYHFDLYRIENVQEIFFLDYEEYLYGEGVSVIEWADRLRELMPKEFLGVELLHQKDQSRLIRISSRGPRYQRLLEQLSYEYSGR